MKAIALVCLLVAGLATCEAACIELYQPVCGKDGKTYSNTCFLGQAGVEKAYDGECEPQSAATPLPIQCAKSDPGARCLLNPCATVRPAPGHTCVPNYCTKPTTYYWQTLDAPPCTAVILDATTFKIVSPVPTPAPPACIELYQPVCGKDGKTYSNTCFLGQAGVEEAYDGECLPAVPPPPAITCAKGDPGAACLLDPCSLVQVAPGMACVPNYCTQPTIYSGQVLNRQPCTAVMVDATTLKIASPVTKPPVTKCSNTYTPVCGADKKTYANACTAKKAGVTFTTGACADLCTLLCVRTKTCDLSTSSCKGDNRLTCQEVRCPTQHLTSSGKVVNVPACSVAYFSKSTGYIQPQCTV